MRLFVALDIDAAIRQRITRFVEGVQGFAPDARWVKPESFHLTLKFLGEMPGERLDEIKSALAGVHAASTSMSFRGTGFFPTPTAARVFWIGIEADPQLPALASAVDDALQSLAGLGIERERQPYKPHLTLARLGARAGGRSSGNPHQRPGRPQPKFGVPGKPAVGLLGGRFARVQEKLAAMPPPDFGTMSAREFFLYQSKLSPAGAQYTKIARFALG